MIFYIISYFTNTFCFLSPFIFCEQRGWWGDTSQQLSRQTTASVTNPYSMMTLAHSQYTILGTWDSHSLLIAHYYRSNDFSPFIGTEFSVVWKECCIILVVHFRFRVDARRRCQSCPCKSDSNDSHKTTLIC